ncbi:uncharacterized protein [Rutidosis leptorrhynchoides]|uniref:uncharacterized protein n=1 Tax=Rutidosis leptorrhynchoides TaxID=125765 RepID=UPI003A99203E
MGDKKEKTKAVGTKLERRKARLKILNLTSNPNLPTKAVKAQSEANFNLNVSRYKAYRALREAHTKLQGDYMDWYLHLRDYIKELQRSNPNTTVRVLTGNQDPNAEAVQFKRIYICLGGLKQGFNELGRDLIGVDGAFMKAPAHGQLLTAVGIDSNNGIYPLAYAMVEQENYNAWCWFLDCLRDDLEMDRTSNFTFMSDRQKGLIHAVEKVFPCAEHRFCLRHIHENMKKKWGGLVCKKQLWNCASATTVPQFEKAMLEMKGLNAACWKYLADIQPKHWGMSHFTGRALSDVLLNNMCEVLNKCLLEARDKPIITALEYVREYLMRRIAVVKGGDDQYQVSGPHNDQCAVDLGAKTCACRKWKLTGMPCKHAVAALNNMALHSENIQVPEQWVHPVYWLETRKKTYQSTITAVNGSALWEKATGQTTLLPPIRVACAGRPKKNRRKGMDENDSMVNNGKLSRLGKTLTCGNCRGDGHNKRTCTAGKSGNDGVSGSKNGAGSKKRKKDTNVTSGIKKSRV